MTTELLKKYWIGHGEMLLLETEPTDVLLLKKFLKKLTCMNACMYVCILCVTAACRGQKKVSDPLDVEFRIAGTLCVCVYSLKSNDVCTP